METTVQLFSMLPPHSSRSAACRHAARSGRLTAPRRLLVSHATTPEGQDMWNEFKTFAFRGNAFDLAIGVIIGLAFGKIVDGIVNLLIMPIIGAATGGLNFDNYFLPLSSAVTATNLVDAQKQGAVFGYGAFITIVI